VERISILKQIDFAFQVTPCVAILGPRQCGKTTEARAEYAKLQTDMAPQNYLASWESFALEQLIKAHNAQADDCYLSWKY
jgi:hypothetical protein